MSRDFANKWVRFQQRYEKLFIPKIRSVLNNQIDQWVRNKSIDYKELRFLIEDLYITTGTQWAAKIHQYMPKRKARLPMGINERVIAIMREVLGLNLEIIAEEITQTTMKYIEEVLSKGFETGASIDEMVNELKMINRKRARVIARTETVSAANEAGIRYAQTFGYDMKKTWLSVQDHRTRHSHLVMNGTTVMINEPFNVNGAVMMQPGARTQPDGNPVPAEEVIQCRCTVIYEVI